ncbi:MAG: hypothetical protein U0T80_06960 [Flavobacteriaceae bacterium]
MPASRGTNGQLQNRWSLECTWQTQMAMPLILLGQQQERSGTNPNNPFYGNDR